MANKYGNAQIDSAVSVEANNQAAVIVDITRGRGIDQARCFRGHKAFSESELNG